MTPCIADADISSHPLSTSIAPPEPVAEHRCPSLSLHYDETYGAVYDDEGRMIKPPSYIHAEHNQNDSGANGAFKPTNGRVARLAREASFTWDKATVCTTSRSIVAKGDLYSPEDEHSHREPCFIMTERRQSIDEILEKSPRVYSPTTSARQVGSSIGCWETLAHSPAEGRLYDRCFANSPQNLAQNRTIELETQEEDDSPYPEVRASVSNLDDPELPVLTFRSLLLGLGLSALVSVFNVFLAQRSPPIQIVSIVLQILAHPLGKFLANVMPICSYTTPRWLGGKDWSLNPGLWNIKEHAVVMIAATTGLNPAYSLSILFAQDLPRFWNEPKPFMYGFLMICAPQLVGLAFSGFCRKFLVEPTSMIWPQTLVVSTVLNTLHAEEEVTPTEEQRVPKPRYSLTRFKFFSLVSAAAFLAYCLPGYLFQALSTFNWICWIWPNNVPVNVVFGVATGLGASVITFDWTQVIFLGSPLITPWWAQVNLFSGFVIGIWVAAPVIYFTNTWNTAYFPMLSGASYDRFGSHYNVSTVSPDHRTFDSDAYQAYSPIYISAGLIVAYFGGFALITSAIVHAALYHGSFIVRIFRQQPAPDDVHARLLKRYKSVPLRWYGGLLLAGIAMTLFLATGYGTGLPMWAVLVSILIPAVYMLPFGFIYAMSGLPMGVNLLSELVASYLLPGKPMPVMMFKTISQQTLTFALLLAEDQKIGHYMKIPPRSVFLVQVLSIMINSVIQILAKNFLRDRITGLCESDQKDQFNCPTVTIFYTASVIWGAIGAERTFGARSMYSSVFYGLLVGAILPSITWFCSQRLGWTRLRYVSTPIIFVGMSLAPPATGINFTSAIVVGLFFQYYMRTRYTEWWSRYNFVLAGAMDFGTILSSMAIYLMLELPKAGGLLVRWWGNEVFMRTADYQSIPLLRVPPGGFGLSSTA